MNVIDPDSVDGIVLDLRLDPVDVSSEEVLACAVRRGVPRDCILLYSCAAADDPLLCDVIEKYHVPHLQKKISIASEIEGYKPFLSHVCKMRQCKRTGHC